MAGVPARIREGMLLLSGDVLLLFTPLQIDYSGQGAAAVSFKEDVETGKNHGVYLRGEDGNVARCLQKQSVETLRSVGAVNEQNKVDIDTGAVIFSPDMLSSLDAMMQGREQEFINDHVRLSLYADFLYPLDSDATRGQFYHENPKGDSTSERTACTVFQPLSCGSTVPKDKTALFLIAPKKGGLACYDPRGISWTSSGQSRLPAP